MMNRPVTSTAASDARNSTVVSFGFSSAPFFSDFACFSSFFATGDAIVTSEMVSKFVRGRHGLDRAARAADDQALALRAQLLQCTSRNVRFHRVIWNKCVTAYARCCNRPAIVDAGDASQSRTDQ